MIFLDSRFTIPNFPSRLLSYLQAGLPVITPVLICNSDEFVPTEKVEGNEVAVGDRIITIAK